MGEFRHEVWMLELRVMAADQLFLHILVRYFQKVGLLTLLFQVNFLRLLWVCVLVVSTHLGDSKLHFLSVGALSNLGLLLGED